MNKKDVSHQTTKEEKIIVRTDRGLSIFGTRITLYQFMDYLTAGNSWSIIKEHFPQLTDVQLHEARIYIEEHYREVESEYQIVLKDAEENRRYWEERNRERFAKIAATPPKPEYMEAWAKLQAKRIKRENKAV